MSVREKVRYRSVVVKFGTSTLTDRSKELSRRRMIELTRQVAMLHEMGLRLIVVTSGALGAGREAYPEAVKSDSSLPVRQMLSSMGQVRLMHLWSEFFAIYNVKIGQVLLSRSDFANRDHYLNVRDTIMTLLDYGVIPVINENDAVTTSRLKFGDNDNLAALVANLVAADALILLTDQEGLYTADPRKVPDAQLIGVVEDVDKALAETAQDGGTSLGTGGMRTKLQAALLATESGTDTLIVSSFQPEVLLRLMRGEPLGTLVPAQRSRLESRKRWLLSEAVRGRLRVDQGAEASLVQRGASLLPVGVVGVEGEFERGAVVQVLGVSSDAIAVGLANYSSAEISRLLRVRSTEIGAILGYSHGDELIHRDDLTLVRGRKYGH